MCGICGFHTGTSGKSIHPGRVSSMNQAMVHRGPDDEGHWHREHVAVAASRLSIMDVEHGHQPMANENESVVVALNGEIYNAPELRRELEGAGCTFRTTCDTEVVLRSWETWGESAIERFNGMFAIAAYDARDDALWLVRDRLGIKPLYYIHRDGQFAFSSELDSLARSGLIPGTVNRNALRSFFQYLYVAGSECIFEGVTKVRPGQWVRFHKGAVASERYWKPEYAIDSSWTLDSAAERYTELLDDAVRMQRLSDVPLGAFLSGGLDSSSVVASLARQQSDPVKTFSIGFDDPVANELPYARAVAEHYRTDHHEVFLQPDIVELSQDFTRHFGEPFADSSAIPTRLVSKLAREHVTVALSGDGGDELFAGYSWLHATLRVGHYRKIPAPLRAAIGPMLNLLGNSPFARKVRRFHSDSALDPMHVFRRRSQCFDDAFLKDLLLPDLHASDADDVFWRLAGESASYDDPDRMLFQDTVMYLPDDILTKVDRMSMAVSLEARVPLLDHRLVEFAATVPFHLKYAHGVSKRLAKHAMRDRLPAAALEQRKRGFAIPIHRWFREELTDYFQDTVMHHDSRCRAYLDMCEVKRVVDVHQAGRENYGHHLWVLLMFEQWLAYAARLPDVSLSF